MCSNFICDAKRIHNYRFFDKETLINSLSSIKLNFKFNPDLGFAEMYLNDVETEIRTIEVSSFVSKV
jgi:cytidylate kinase